MTRHRPDHEEPDHEEALEQELLELYFGCHADPKSIEARLQSDPELQQLYVEVQEKAALLVQAAHGPQPELDLPIDRADAPIKPFSMRSRIVRVSIAAAAAIVLFVPAYLNWVVKDFDRDAIVETLVQVSLASDQATPDGAPITFAVSTLDYYRNQIACAIAWRALDASGQALATGNATIGNVGHITLPAQLHGVRRFEVTAETPRGPKQVGLDISPTLAVPLVHLATSKPIYRPGERVNIRATSLDRLDLTPLPLGSQPKITILDPRDSKAGRLDLSHLGHGTYAAEWIIPENITEGRYELQVTQTGQTEPAAVQSIVVRRFQAPRLAKKVDLDRTTYAPDSYGTAEVSVTRLAGGAAAGADVQATLIIDGETCWTQAAQLSATGTARFRFQIPKNVAKGAARFTARITDGGTIETIVEPFVVPTGEIAATLFPEGGDLVVGLTSRVYVEVMDLLDRPISATGRVVDAAGNTVAQFETEHQGRGHFALTPSVGVQYTLEIDRPNKLRVELPEAKSRGVVLHADTAQPQGKLGLTLQSNADGHFTVIAFCRGALVGQSQITGQGTHSIALPIEKAQGVLRVTVFDAAMRPHAERLVRVHQARRIDITMVAEHEYVAPGAEQQIKLTARDERGEPAGGCVISLAVSDGAVWARSGEPRIGLANTLDLFGDVHPLDDLSAYLPGDENSARNADLLLATQAWRRFAWQAPTADITPVLARAGALDGYNPQRTAVASQRETSEAMRTVTSAVQQSRRGYEDWGRTLILLSALYLFIEGFLLTGRTLHRVTPWREGPILGGLTGIAVLGLTVLFSTSSGLVQRAAGEFDAKGLWGRGDHWAFNAPDAAALRDDFGEFGVEVAEGAAVPPEVYFHDVDGDANGRLEWDKEEMAGPDAIFVGVGGQEPPIGVIDLNGNFVRNRNVAYDGKLRNRPDREVAAWQPYLITNAEGHAETSFHVSNRITTWVAHADAYGSGRVGQSELRFDAKLPFYLEAKLPTEVTEGDSFRIPIALVTETDDSEAIVQIKTTGGAVLSSSPTAKTTLTAGRGRVLADITIQSSDKPTTIAIRGRVGTHSHQQRSPIRVVPSGFPHHRSWAGKTKPEGTSFTIALPEGQKPRNPRATLKLFPSPLASLRESLQGIVREPHGCFEQASSSNYPNTMVLTYLEATGDSIPALANRAREMLPKGYDLITSYECKQHGYEWFGHDPGHETLTAYGLLQFTDMQKVTDVDADMIANTRDWLLARRDGDGGYGRKDQALDSFGGSTPAVNNAYITYALLYSGMKAESLKTEIDAINARSTSTEDAYELALIASALREAGRDDDAAIARRRLAGLQKSDGSVPSTSTSITSSGGDDLIVESTSFAILAWIGDETHTARVLQAIEYLQTKQSASGTFGATQATIMALKALTAFATNRPAIPEAGTLHVSIDGEGVVSKQYTADVVGAVEVDLTKFLTTGEHVVTIELQGAENPLPWACDLEYYADQPADDVGALIRIKTSLTSTEVSEGDTVAVTAVIENLSDKGQAMTMAIIGLPASLEVPTKVLDDLKQADQFAFWELRGREVILYWRDMAPKTTRTIILDTIARIPGTTTGPASRSYLYYTPDLVDWAPPLRITVR